MKCFAYAATIVALTSLTLLAAPARADEKPEPKSVKPNAAFDSLRTLVGTWEEIGKDGKPRIGKDGKPMTDKDGKPLTLVFKITSHGSALVESMFPGSEHEMINVYTVDGDKVAFTHYCAMGNQPHMQLKSADNGTLTFEFVNGGNITSRDEPHMDSLVITIAGDHLTEKWGMYSDGKATDHETFEFTRKK